MLYGRSSGGQITGWAISNTCDFTPLTPAALTSTLEQFNGSPNREISHFRAATAEDMTTDEAVVVDSSIIRFKHYAKPQLEPTDQNVFKSSYIIDHMGSAADVLAFFNRITMVKENRTYAQNESKLADLIVKFCHDGASIDIRELQQINEEVMPEDCAYLNKICYHFFIKRVVRWVVSASDQQDGLWVPMATAQARTLRLIQQGILTFQEVFSQDGNYGIFYNDEYIHDDPTPELPLRKAVLKETAASLADDGVIEKSIAISSTGRLQLLRQKIKHINYLYQKYVVELEPDNFLPTVQFFKQHENGGTIPTYKKLHAELCALFGGEGDEGGHFEKTAYAYGANDNKLQELFQQIKL